MNVEVTFELLRPHECQRQTGLSGSTGSPTDERCLGRSHCPMRGSPDYVRAIVERALGTQQFVGAGLIFHSGRGPSMQGHAGRATSARTEIRPRGIRGAGESCHNDFPISPTCFIFVQRLFGRRYRKQDRPASHFTHDRSTRPTTLRSTRRAVRDGLRGSLQSPRIIRQVAQLLGASRRGGCALSRADR